MPALIPAGALVDAQHGFVETTLCTSPILGYDPIIIVSLKLDDLGRRTAKTSGVKVPVAAESQMCRRVLP
jgi:hypothetical protein